MNKINRGGNAATEAKAPIHFFDTMNAVKQLEEAGVPRAQAQAYVVFVRTVVSEAMTSMRETVATKADHQVLEGKMDAGFKVLDGKMDSGFKAVNETTAAKSDVKALDVKIKWLIGTLLIMGSLVASGEGGLINSMVRALIASLGG